MAKGEISNGWIGSSGGGAKGVQCDQYQTGIGYKHTEKRQKSATFGLPQYTGKTAEHFSIYNSICECSQNQIQTTSVELKIHPPTIQEKAWAMEYLIRKSLQMNYGQEIAGLSKGKGLPEKSRIESLKPFIDEQGILRVGGRLERSELNFERNTLLSFRMEHA